MTKRESHEPDKLQWPKFVADVEKRLKRLYEGPNTGATLYPLILPVTIALVLAKRADVKHNLWKYFNTDPDLVYKLLEAQNEQAHGEIIDAQIEHVDSAAIVESPDGYVIPWQQLERVPVVSQEYLQHWKNNIRRATMERLMAHDREPVNATENFLGLLESIPPLHPIFDIIMKNQQVKNDALDTHAERVGKRQSQPQPQPHQRKHKRKGLDDDGVSAVGK